MQMHASVQQSPKESATTPPLLKSVTSDESSKLSMSKTMECGLVSPVNEQSIPQEII